MIVPVFEQNQTYLPITPTQFEGLTNEILIHINNLLSPQALNGDSMAEVLMGVIHALDRKESIVNKSDLFDRCVNHLSKNATYNIIQHMKSLRNAPAEQSPVDNVVSIGEDPA